MPPCWLVTHQLQRRQFHRPNCCGGREGKGGHSSAIRYCKAVGDPMEAAAGAADEEAALVVAVGSRNPVKVNATSSAFARCFGGRRVECIGIDVPR
eukprot:SAG31_NODE_7209_length_1755_cov_1.355072_3_plen_96_part_00